MAAKEPTNGAAFTAVVSVRGRAGRQFAASLYGDHVTLEQRSEEEASSVCGCFRSQAKEAPLSFSVAIGACTLSPPADESETGLRLHCVEDGKAAVDYELIFPDVATKSKYAEWFTRLRNTKALAVGNPLSPVTGGAFPIGPPPPAPRVRAHVLARASVNLTRTPSSTANSTATHASGAPTGSLAGSSEGPPQLLSPERSPAEAPERNTPPTAKDPLKRLEEKLKSTALSRNRALSNIASSGAAAGAAHGGGVSAFAGSANSGNGGITGMASIDVSLLPSLPPLPPPPPAGSPDEADYKERKYRHSVYSEILESEKRYYRDLQVLRDVFETPLRNSAHSAFPILLPHEVALIFGNLDQLIEVHAALLQALCTGLVEPKQDTHQQAQQHADAGADAVMSPAGRNGAGSGLFSEMFAEAFSRVCPFMRLHAVYAKSYFSALKLIKKKRQRAAAAAAKGKRKSKVSANKRASLKLVMAPTPSPGASLSIAGDRKSIGTSASSVSSSALSPQPAAPAQPLIQQEADDEAFEEFLSFCALKPETRRLDLESFLIMPIQRLCRYPLLLKDLLRHMPDAHPNRKKIQLALAEVEKIAAAVNERLTSEHRATLLLECHDLLDRCIPDLIQPGRNFVLDINDAELSFPLGKAFTSQSAATAAGTTGGSSSGATSFFELFSSSSSGKNYRIIITTDLLILARFSHIGSRRKFGNGEVVPAEDGNDDDEDEESSSNQGSNGAAGAAAAAPSAHLVGWAQNKRYKVIEVLPLKDVTVVGAGEFAHRHKRSRSGGGMLLSSPSLGAPTKAVASEQQPPQPPKPGAGPISAAGAPLVPTPTANRILKLTATKVVAAPITSPAKEKKKAKAEKRASESSNSDQQAAHLVVLDAPSVAVLRFDIHFRNGAECEKVGRVLVKTINAAVDLAKNLEERRAQGADQSKIRAWKRKADGKSGGSNESASKKAADGSAASTAGNAPAAAGSEVQQQLDALKASKLSSVPPLAGMIPLPPSPGNPNTSSARTGASGGNLAVWGIARWATADEGTSSGEGLSGEDRDHAGAGAGGGDFATPKDDEGVTSEDDNPGRFIRSTDEDDDDFRHRALAAVRNKDGDDEYDEEGRMDGDDDDDDDDMDNASVETEPGEEPQVTFGGFLSYLIFGGISAVANTITGGAATSATTVPDVDAGTASAPTLRPAPAPEGNASSGRRADAATGDAESEIGGDLV